MTYASEKRLNSRKTSIPSRPGSIQSHDIGLHPPGDLERLATVEGLVDLKALPIQVFPEQGQQVLLIFYDQYPDAHGEDPTEKES